MLRGKPAHRATAHHRSKCASWPPSGNSCRRQPHRHRDGRPHGPASTILRALVCNRRGKRLRRWPRRPPARRPGCRSSNVPHRRSDSRRWSDARRTGRATIDHFAFCKPQPSQSSARGRRRNTPTACRCAGRWCRAQALLSARRKTPAGLPAALQRLEPWCRLPRWPLQPQARQGRQLKRRRLNGQNASFDPPPQDPWANIKTRLSGFWKKLQPRFENFRRNPFSG